MDSLKTGGLIAEARKEKNMTQRQLAEALHVSDRAVSKWERGAGFPDISLLEPLADTLGLSVTELLRGEKQETPTADEEVRLALKTARQYRKDQLKRNIRDIIMLLVCIALIAFFAVHFADRFGAFSEEIHLELTAGVYVDGVHIEDTDVVIEGTRNDLQDEFRGRIAINYIEKSCREQAQAHVVWDESGQVIGYFGYGQLGLVPLNRWCYFSTDMRSFAIKNRDEGLIIATDAYLAELMALDGYYPLAELGNKFYYG